jgi:hypothetical protein
MKVYLTKKVLPLGPYKYPAWKHPLDQFFGKSFYFSQVEGFLESLVAYSYKGRTITHGVFERPRIHFTPWQPVEQIRELAGGLVHNLFAQKATHAGKSHWCEKTPANMTRIVGLSLMFPEAKHIIIVRDPRDMACSLSERKLRWSPNKIEETMLWNLSFLRCWLNIKRNLTTEVWLEVRYEDLACNGPATFERVSRFLNLEMVDAFRLTEVFGKSVGRWRKELSKEQKRWFVAEGVDVLAEFGYELT